MLSVAGDVRAFMAVVNSAVVKFELGLLFYTS